MRYYALDNNGNPDPARSFANPRQDTETVEAPEIPDTIQNPVWSNGEWTEDITLLKADKLDEINTACDDATSDISSKYPRSEMDTWPEQVKEAEAYQADNSASVPMLETIANARGITVADQADRVMTRFSQYTAQVGQAVGKRQKLEEQIQTIAADSNLTDAEKIDQIQAISW